jgi:hypothetical protein
MIMINMPGGAIESVKEKDLLWMRKAFPDERKDAVMLNLGQIKRFSIESLDDLRRKFAAAGVRLADFTPPVGKLVVVVNTGNVGEVKPANPIFVHENARAVLQFSPRVMLAVRETVDEANAKIAAAARPAARAVARAARTRPRADVA